MKDITKHLQLLKIKCKFAVHDSLTNPYDHFFKKNESQRLPYDRDHDSEVNDAGQRVVTPSPAFWFPKIPDTAENFKILESLLKILTEYQEFCKSSVMINRTFCC